MNNLYDIKLSKSPTISFIAFLQFSSAATAQFDCQMAMHKTNKQNKIPDKIA